MYHRQFKPKRFLRNKMKTNKYHRKHTETNFIVYCTSCSEHFSPTGKIKKSPQEPLIIQRNECSTHSQLASVGYISLMNNLSDAPSDNIKPIAENFLPIQVGKLSFLAMIDSGASICTINSRDLKLINPKYKKKLQQTKRFIRGVTGNHEAILNSWKITFISDELEYSGIFHEIKSFDKIILGQDFLTKNLAEYNFASATIKLNGNLHALRGNYTRSSIVKIKNLVTIEPHCIKDIWIKLSRPVRDHESYNITPLGTFNNKFPELQINECIVNQQVSKCRIINGSNLPYILPANLAIGIARYVSQTDYITTTEFENIDEYYNANYVSVCNRPNDSHSENIFPTSYHDVYCAKFLPVLTNDELEFQGNYHKFDDEDKIHNHCDMMDILRPKFIKYHGEPPVNGQALCQVNPEDAPIPNRKHYCFCISDQDCFHWDLCRLLENRPEVLQYRNFIDSICMCVRHRRNIDFNKLDRLIKGLRPVRVYNDDRCVEEDYIAEVNQHDDCEATEENLADNTSNTDPIKNRLHGILMNIGDDISAADKDKFRKFLEKNHKAFASNIAQMGKLRDYEYEVKLKPGTKEICAKPYSINPKLLPLLDDELSELERSGLIESSDSTFRSPILVLKKKSLEPNKPRIRLVIDFRKVNAVVEKDYWPILNIQEIISFFAHEKPKYISTIDFFSGYWQIGVKENSRNYLSAVTARRNIRFQRLPQGFHNSSAVFCKQIHRVLGSTVNRHHGLLYVDDLVVCSQTIQEMIENLQPIFDKVIEYGLTFSALKSSFLKRKALFVGHVFSENGIEVNHDKTKVVHNFPIPKSVKNVRSFLGLTNYFRSFLRDYSKIARPLHELTRSTEPFVWNDERNQSFETLKKMLSSPPVLKYPVDNLDFHLVCDASVHSLGYILYQKAPTKREDPYGKPKPSDEYQPGIIEFGSRGLTLRERSYSIHQLECLSLLEGFRKFHYYLVHAHTYVHTDRTSLIALSKSGSQKKINHSSTMINRWMLEISNYSHTLCYINTKENPADVLSRLPNPPEQPNYPKTPFQEIYDVDTLHDEHNDITQFSDESDSRDHILDVPGNGCSMSPNVVTNAALNFVQLPEVPKEPVMYEYCLTLNASSPKDNDMSIIEEPIRALAQVDIAKLQRECPRVSELYNFIKYDRIKPSSKIVTPAVIAMREQFQIQNGVLMHVYQNRLKIGRNRAHNLNNQFTWRVVVPLGLRKAVLKECHDDAGHFSAQRTFERMRMSYYWKFCFRDVQNYCHSCMICQKASKHKPLPPRLRPLEAGDSLNVPCRRASLDICGPLTLTKNRMAYILSYIDHSTSYSFFLPLRNVESDTIARVLHDRIFTMFGCCSNLLTDLGRNLIYSTMAKLSTLWGCERLRTASYEPQTNSMIERSHRTLNRVVAKHCAENHSNWDEHLPAVNFALRSAISSRTGVSSIFALCGFQPVGAIERNLPVSSTISIPRDDIAYFIESMKISRQTQHEYICQSQKDSIKMFDRRAKDRKFSVGDIVLLHSPVVRSDQCRKLVSPYSGPYKIIYATEAGTTFQLQNVSDGNKTNMINIRRIIKCYLPSECTTRLQLEEAERNHPIQWKDSNHNGDDADEPETLLQPASNRNIQPNMPPQADVNDDIPPPRRNPKRAKDNRPNSIAPPNTDAIRAERQKVIDDVRRFHKDNTNRNDKNNHSASNQLTQQTQQSSSGTSDTSSQDEEEDDKIDPNDIIRIVDIYKTSCGKRFKLKLRSTPTQKWYAEDEIKRIPDELLQEVLTRRTWSGQQRRSYRRSVNN